MTSQQERYNLFAVEYSNNGLVASKAYKYVNPKASTKTAEVMGSRWLSKIEVKEAIQREIDKRKQLNTFSKDELLNRINSLSHKAENKDKLQTALNATVEIAKMQGYYEKEGESGQIEKVLQAFQVNVEVKNEVNMGEKGKTFTHEVKSEVIDNK